MKVAFVGQNPETREDRYKHEDMADGEDTFSDGEMASCEGVEAGEENGDSDDGEVEEPSPRSRGSSLQINKCLTHVGDNVAVCGEASLPSDRTDPAGDVR